MVPSPNLKVARPHLFNELLDADIEHAITAEQYHIFVGTCLTVCCLTLHNGFTVTGESACVYPPSFDAQRGREAARASAKLKVWMLEGYRLKEWLSLPPNTSAHPALVAMPAIRYSPSEMAPLDTRPMEFDPPIG